jgi:hypothetical protein
MLSTDESSYPGLEKVTVLASWPADWREELLGSIVVPTGSSVITLQLGGTFDQSTGLPTGGD